MAVIKYHMDEMSLAVEKGDLTRALLHTKCLYHLIFLLVKSERRRSDEKMWNDPFNSPDDDATQL